MRLLKVLYGLFAGRLRLSNPWNYKVPFLIAVPYLLFLREEFEFLEALKGFGFSLCTIVGFAGFGYLTNDWGDREADRKARKPNVLLEISNLQIALLLGLFLVVAILPWVVYFPLNALTISLLGGEFFLFLLYTLPPFRLKERGFWGILVDALYAHVNPAVLAGYTFYCLSPDPKPHLAWLLVPLGFWQLCLGMRNIVLHQLKDAPNDHISGVQTFVTMYGEQQAFTWTGRIFVPLELFAWLIFLVALTPWTWFPLFAWPLYCIGEYTRRTSKDRPEDLRSALYLYLDDFYIGWFPLLILLALCVNEPWMLVIAVLHLLLFKSAFSRWRNKLFQWLGGGK